VKDLFNALDTWHGSGRDAAIARVVDLDGSGPRLPGAAMAVNLDQDVRGSVSGGCVEGAVVVEALDVMEESKLARETLGEHVFEWFLRNKRAEWADFQSRVTPFELERYLGNW